MIELRRNFTRSIFLDDEHFIYDYQEGSKSLTIFIKSKPHACNCPKCGISSRKLDSTYHRKLQDTPVHGKTTYLCLDVYKYKCLNPQCSCHVFTEQLSFAKTSQVRTDALNEFILGVAMFLSNEGASKVLALLGVKVSNDTIQSLYDRLEFIDDPDVEAVGIDDVAIRKGQTYATAIYDMKDHHMIALLDGRDGETLKKWLKGHHKIRVIARDRASAYASAISEILPNCVQVADRFHLFQNLLDYLKDIFKEELPSEIFIRDGAILDAKPEKIVKEKRPDEALLNTLHYDNTPPKHPDGTVQNFDNKRHDYDSPQYKKAAEGRKKNKN